MIMTPGLRKFMFTLHITSSIGWFGAVAGFLALSIVDLARQDAQMVRAVYLVMGLTTWFVIVPLALASLLTGVVSSLGTRWGLFRYYWVLTKFLITILATLILLVHTQPIDLLVSVAAKTAVLSVHLYRTQIQMVVASSGTLVVLLALTVLSVYKPCGMTRYGWQKQQEQLTASAVVDITTDQARGIVHELENNGAHTVNFKQESIVTHERDREWWGHSPTAMKRILCLERLRRIRRDETELSFISSARFILDESLQSGAVARSWSRP